MFHFCYLLYIINIFFYCLPLKSLNYFMCNKTLGLYRVYPIYFKLSIYLSIILISYVFRYSIESGKSTDIGLVVFYPPDICCL